MAYKGENVKHSLSALLLFIVMMVYIMIFWTQISSPTNNYPIVRLGIRQEGEEVIGTQNFDQLMEEYWEASQKTYPHIKNISANLLPGKKYQKCAAPTANATPILLLPSFQNITTTVLKRYTAEEFWRNQRGNIYMQHSRKAGGTTLCMTLRLNSKGLIRQTNEDWTIGKRETCQICQFCCDCNLEKMPYFHSFQTMPRLLNCVLEMHGRNFFESEGTVSPPDLLTNMEWSNYVFVSSIRHPISRILSSLDNDPRYKYEKCKLNSNPSAITSCGHEAIGSDNTMINECAKSIYYCYSNYYVRMFAGISHKKEVTSSSMQKAKQNFERYSCVVLQESWEDTVGCLKHRLALNLQHDGFIFNLGGNILAAAEYSNHTTKEVTNLTSSFLQKITSVELDRLTQLNSYDLEFYEWAKGRILSQAEHKWDRSQS